MFVLLTVLTVLIASMVVGLVATTLKELRQETVQLKVTAIHKVGR